MKNCYRLKNMNKRIFSGILVAMLLFCGGCSGKEAELLTLDVFAGRANYQGFQEGWYAKIVKDKFNLEFNIISPNISGGGNLTFESRLAAGKVGDIVITSYENIEDCIEEGVLADISPYLEKTTYLKQYMDVIEVMNQKLGVEDAIYFIPTSMSKMSPTEPILYGDKPDLASFMPWDYYSELGCPVIENEEDLLDVLTQMQENHPYTEDGEKTYGFSLYRDWDVEYMSLAANMVRSYGYIDTTDSVFTNADLSETQRVIEDGGIYYRMLHLYFSANQRGLLDPESGVQNFDDMTAKVKNKQILYLWWAWMMGSYNDKTVNDGYVFIPVSLEPLVCEGFSKYGDGYAYAVGNATEDVERVIEYLDWMASPEGMMYYGAGLEDVGYTYVGKKPTYTEYSLNAWKYGQELSEEYGGGSYSEGFCQFNDSIVEINDINPETGESYYSENWTTSIEGYKGATEKEWTEHYGYESPAEYLIANNLLDVVVQTDFVQERETVELTLIRERCASLVKEYSWKMIFAEDEEQFQKYWADLKELLYQSGYEQEEAADMEIIEQMRASREETLQKYGQEE